MQQIANIRPLTPPISVYSLSHDPKTFEIDLIFAYFLLYITLICRGQALNNKVYETTVNELRFRASLFAGARMQSVSTIHESLTKLILLASSSYPPGFTNLIFMRMLIQMITCLRKGQNMAKHQLFALWNS